MRVLRPLSVIGLSLFLAGCFTSSTVINLQPDGSGTIDQTMTMSAQAAAQLTQMMAGFGKPEDKKGGFFNEQEMRDAAPKMGEGVTFVSAAPIHTAEAEGTKARYAFTDITKLRLNQKPATPGGAGEMGQMPGGSGAEDILFRFARNPGGTSVVTVVFPERKIDAARKTATEKADKNAEAMQGAAMAMAKQMFNGLKISIVLQPAGRIVKTNSPFVAGQQVTLLEIDFSQFLSDPGMLTKLQEAGSLEDAKALMKDAKGVKVSLDREVRVEFAGR